jgi:TonB family protein
MSPHLFRPVWFRRVARLRRAAALLSLAAVLGASAAEPVTPAGDAKRKVQAPVAIRTVPPVHPPGLKKDLISGEALLECLVDANGEVQDIKVIMESHPGFAAAAEEALQLWEFKPGSVNGEPAPVRIRVPFDFRLSLDEILSSIAGRPVYEEIKETVIPAQQLPAWPRPLQLRTPRYPPELADTGKYGKVVVNITIDKEGRVINPRIVKSTYPEFVIPALITALQLQFPPQVMANREKIYVSMDIQWDMKPPANTKTAPEKAAKPAKSK